MKLASWVADVSVRRRKLVVAVTLLLTGLVALGAALPSIWPDSFPALHGVRVDTDPENMLEADEPSRVFHDEVRERFGLHDMVVVGVVDDEHADGVFHPEALAHVHDLAEFAKTLRWKDEDGEEAGVIGVDLLAPSTVDDISQGGMGSVRFEWLMPVPPTTAEEARAVRERAQRIPFLNGTLVSEDGRALALYIPLTAKDLSYRVGSELKERIATYGGSEQYHITGLPIAEDTFGVEMFIQMAVSAPIAMVVIFLLMLWFFRRMALVAGPMIIAMISVILTMGALIMTGNPVHIMSSMIPIFIMPIAVLDSVHVLSEFFDRYRETGDRAATIRTVMDELFTPMLYTSLTSAAGFLSLALTPIPPVQVFGIFVAMGIIVAWLLTILFIPAYVAFLPESTFEGFGASHDEDEASGISRVLRRMAPSVHSMARPVLVVSVLLLAVAGWGISRIVINDNPVKWFSPDHEIRVADRVLNDHFGGTYMAYLALEAAENEWDPAAFKASVAEKLESTAAGLTSDGFPELSVAFDGFEAELGSYVDAAADSKAALEALETLAEERADSASSDDEAESWDEILGVLSSEGQSGQVFKDPEVLRWMSSLQERLVASGKVGKSSSLSDIVQTVHRELFLGEEAQYRIPDTSAAVAQCLLTYQSSHRPDDLWHFVTPDYREASLWLQLTSGDNRDMVAVHGVVDAFVAENPPPGGLEPHWFGLTHINVVWQDKMVAGMLKSLAGAFVVVLLLMIVLFRSILWGLLAMVPLTLTIALVYGAVGIMGKPYDMPVAVLSSLALGLAIDFAIHFLARARRETARHGSWKAALPVMFDEPARAITRNAIVIAVGFLPLLFAPLVPYQTVGVLLAAILGVSGVATLLLLPALLGTFEARLFRDGADHTPVES